jgi:hypothetical protein
MSLTKNSLVAGGSSIQTYLKEGNNINTEPVEEWIVIEDRNLLKNTGYQWRLGDRDFNIRLVSLWAITTGNIVITIQNKGTNVIILAINNTQAASGFVFPTLVLPSKLDILITPAENVASLFLFAKEIAIPVVTNLSR